MVPIPRHNKLVHRAWSLVSLPQFQKLGVLLFPLLRRTWSHEAHPMSPVSISNFVSSHSSFLRDFDQQSFCIKVVSIICIALVTLTNQRLESSLWFWNGKWNNKKQMIIVTMAQWKLCCFLWKLFSPLRNLDFLEKEVINFTYCKL